MASKLQHFALRAYVWEKSQFSNTYARRAIFYKFLLTLEQAPKHLFNNVLSTCCLVGLKLLSLSQELQDIIKLPSLIYDTF